MVYSPLAEWRALIDVGSRTASALKNVRHHLGGSSLSTLALVEFKVLQLGAPRICEAVAAGICSRPPSIFRGTCWICASIPVRTNHCWANAYFFQTSELLVYGHPVQYGSRWIHSGDVASPSPLGLHTRANAFLICISPSLHVILPRTATVDASTLKSYVLSFT